MTIPRTSAATFSSMSMSVSMSTPNPTVTPAPAEVPAADCPTERRARRLAEMVAGLTGCPPDGALDAVRANLAAGDPLETVARAMIALESPEPDRLRITGYLRPRPAGRRAPSPVPHPPVTPVVPAATPAGDDDWSDDVIFDLRVEHARVRIDLTMMDRSVRGRRDRRRR
jgi:hypothetical protein